jgi:hypothetical protein
MTLTGEHHAGKLVLDRYCDVGIRLVIAQPNIEARTVSLDQVLFEVKRLTGALRDDHLDSIYALDHPIETDSTVAAAKVRPDSGTKGVGLPDVENLIARITK